jgi:hypothetical protein
MAPLLKERLAGRIAAVRRMRGMHEQTTSGNVGGFEVPIGAPLKPTFPSSPRKRKKRPKG